MRTIAAHPSAGGHLMSTRRTPKRQSRDQGLREELAAAIPGVFGAIEPAAVRAIERIAEWVRIGAGETLFDAGDEADAAYLMILGRLHLSTISGGEEMIFAEVVSGEVVGGMGLIEDGTRAAKATAVRDSYLVRFPRDGFSKLAKSHPTAALNLTRSMLAAVKPPTMRRFNAENTSIAIMGGATAEDIRMFATRLVEEFSSHGPAAHIWGARADSALGLLDISQAGGDGPEAIALMRWLHELELKNSILVYECDPTWTAWSQRAVRQADLVVILADPTQTSPTRRCRQPRRKICNC